MTDLLTVKEVARMLRVSVPGIYKMAHARRLPCIEWNCPQGEGKSRVKTTLRFEVEAIQSFIQDHRKGLNQC